MKLTRWGPQGEGGGGMLNARCGMRGQPTGHAREVPFPGTEMPEGRAEQAGPGWELREK